MHTPIFQKDRPSLADLGIGVSLYFQTVLLLSFIFLAMFITCLPTIVIAFMVSPPGAGDPSTTVGSASGVMSALSVLTVAGVFQRDGSRYGCNTETCVLRDGTVVSATMIVSVIVYCDLACCLALLLCLPLIRRLFRNHAEAVDAGNSKPSPLRANPLRGHTNPPLSVAIQVWRHHTPAPPWSNFRPL